MIQESLMWIGHERRRSEKRVEIRSPYSQECVGMVHQAGKGDIDNAVDKAVKVSAVMKQMPSCQRAEILSGVAALIRRDKEKLARTICLEAGKTISDARIEVERAVNTFTIASEEAKRIGGEVIPLDLLPSSAGRLGILRRFPLGPIAGITPFNFPLNLVAHKVAPAVAAGNPIIIKPASAAPTAALLLGEMVHESGIPDGGISVVPCPGSVGETLVADDRIKMLTFTGSAEIGWYLKERAGKKKVTLELGGNAAVIVHDDADLGVAVPRCVRGSFSYAGQVCIAIQRIYVHEDIYGEFLKRFAAETGRLKSGDPSDDNTDLSPMINEAAAIRAEAWIQEAVGAGAQIIIGGKRDGTCLEPTVLTHTKPEMNVNAEEVFAPIVTIEKYHDFIEAVEKVNDSRFGLQAGVFTQHVRRIFHAYEHLEVGGLIVNDIPTYRTDHMPYGGVKDSGIGREGVRYAIEEMTELKLMALNLSQ